MTDKPNKNCTHCLAYNIDHCAAKECKGVVTVLRHSQARQLPDETIRKYYENMFRNDSSNEKCCANCKYWIEIYQKCDHPEQFACKAEPYDAMPEDICELYEGETNDDIDS